MDDLIKRIGNRVEELRIENNVSRAKLEESCGLAALSIKHLERGPRPKSYNVVSLCSIAAFFDVDPEYLLGLQDCKRRDVADASKVTGLSYEAVEVLKSWVNSDDRRQYWPEYLSRIIEDSESPRLFGNLSDIIGNAFFTAKLWDDTESMEQLKERNVACLWYLSRNLTNIVERLFVKEIDTTMQSENRKGN